MRRSLERDISSRLLLLARCSRRRPPQSFAFWPTDFFIDSPVAGGIFFAISVLLLLHHGWIHAKEDPETSPKVIIHSKIFALVCVFYLFSNFVPPARGRVVVCFVFVCKYVLGHSRVSQPLNLRLCLLRHLGFLTSPYASPTCRRRRVNSYRLLHRFTPDPPPIPWAHPLYLPASPRPPLYTSTMTT